MTAFFRTAKVRFDQLLETYGFRLAVEHYDHEHFGNGWAEYSRRGIRLRLVWNGREGVLALTYQRRMLSRIPLGTWVDVEATDADPRPFVRDGSLARLDALEAATRQLLETWHTPAYKRWQRKRESRPST